MSEKIDKIIFDFDGTVADTFQLNVGLIKEMRPDTSKKEIELFRNNGVAVLQKELNLSLKEVLKLLGLLAKKQMQIINKAKIFPGIKNIFDELRKRDIKIIILSSNTTENIEKWLVHQKIKVDKIITNNNIFGKDKLLRKMGRQFVYVAHMVSMKALDAICKFFKEADSVNNIMRLVSSGVDFLKKIKWNTFHFESFANTFKPVIPFFSAKGVFQKIQSLASGEAASQDVFPGECNWWKVASKITSGLSDIITGAKWLTEMKLLPDGWSKENLPKPIHGVSLNAKDSVQDALGVISSTTNIISTARKIWRTWTVSFKSLFDIAMDVARIAATLFKNAAYFAPKESPVAAIGLFVGVCVGTGSLAKSIVEAF